MIFNQGSKMKNTIILLITYLVSFSAIAENTWIYNSNKDCAIYDSFSGESIEIFWTGECKNGKANGLGVAIFYEKSNKEKWLKRYEGVIVEGLYDGSAYLEWPNEKKVGGEFFRGHLNGDVVIFENGDSFEATYKEGVEQTRSLNKYGDEEDLDEYKYSYKILDVSDDKPRYCSYLFSFYDIARFTGGAIEDDDISEDEMSECKVYSNRLDEATAHINKLLQENNKDETFYHKYGNLIGRYYFDKQEYKKSFDTYRKVPMAGYGSSQFETLNMLTSSEFQQFGTEKDKALHDFSAQLALYMILVGDYKKAQEVCSKGSSCDTYLEFKNEYGETPLIEYSAYKGLYLKAIKYLVNKGVAINQRDKTGATALMNAAYAKNIEVVNYLLAQGAGPNIETNNGFTALKFAIIQNELETVKALIKNGANVNHRDKRDKTPLMNAISKQNTDLISLLVKSGAKINAKDSHGNTALILAIVNDFDVIKEQLLNLGASTGGVVSYFFDEEKSKPRKVYTYENAELVKVEEYSKYKDVIDSRFVRKTPNKFYVERYKWQPKGITKEEVSETYYLVNRRRHGLNLHYYDGRVTKKQNFIDGLLVESINFHSKYKNNVYWQSRRNMETKVMIEKYYYKDGLIKSQHTLEFNDKSKEDVLRKREQERKEAEAKLQQ